VPPIRAFITRLNKKHSPTFSFFHEVDSVRVGDIQLAFILQFFDVRGFVQCTSESGFPGGEFLGVDVFSVFTRVLGPQLDKSNWIEWSKKH
jgi:hypothetical protein